MAVEQINTLGLTLGERMVRYRGPKNRIARRFGVNIFGRARSPLLHKQHPPGQHGTRRRKKSDYGLQLEEKQKLKAVYGMIREKTLVRYYRKALNAAGNTMDNFQQLLETRLDNVVYRLKMAPTIFAAQQLVAHGHVEVDGKKVDIRSFQVKPGMIISIREKSRKMPAIQAALENAQRETPTYMQVDPSKFEGSILSLPTREDVPLPIEINIPEVCDLLAHTN